MKLHESLENMTDTKLEVWKKNLGSFDCKIRLYVIGDSR